MTSLGLKGLLIFDSNPNHAHSYPTKSLLSSLEVIHSPIHTSADSYILEYLSTIKHRAHLQVVTSDNAIIRGAKALRVATLSSTEFFSLLSSLSLKKNTLKKELKPLFDSKKELERLQKIFESKS